MANPTGERTRVYWGLVSTAVTEARQNVASGKRSSKLVRDTFQISRYLQRRFEAEN